MQSGVLQTVRASPNNPKADSKVDLEQKPP